MAETILTWLGALVSLVCGVHAIVTKKVMFGDDGDELQVWLYGWRAVVIGCLAVAAAAAMFASAVGLIHLPLA